MFKQNPKAHTNTFEKKTGFIGYIELFYTQNRREKSIFEFLKKKKVEHL